MENDKELVGRLKDGDQLAYTQLYIKYHKLVYSIAYKYLYDAYRAEDAVQWLFLRVWEYREKIREEVPFKSFIHVILRNYLLNELRHQYNTDIHLQEYVIGQETIQDTIEGQMEWEECSKMLQGCIETLPPQRQKICRMKIHEECSNQEIADKLQLSVNTVKVQYNQIIKTLKLKMNFFK